MRILLGSDARPHKRSPQVEDQQVDLQEAMSPASRGIQKGGGLSDVTLLNREGNVTRLASVEVSIRQTSLGGAAVETRTWA